MPLYKARGKSREFTIYYEVEGKGNRRSVLLGHGLLEGLTPWRKIAKELASDYCVLTVQVRGHGNSTAPEPFTLDDLVSDWLGIMAQENIGRAALCGLSMGGMTALRVALKEPDRVAGLILIATSADAEPPEKLSEYKRLKLAYVIAGLGFIKKSYFEIMYGKTAHEHKRELMEVAFEESQQHRRIPIRRAINAVIRRDSVVFRLGEISSPTKILLGDEDLRTTPQKYSDQLREGIAGAQFERIRQTGHLAAVENPELLANHIRDFLPQCNW